MTRVWQGAHPAYTALHDSAERWSKTYLCMPWSPRSSGSLWCLSQSHTYHCSYETKVFDLEVCGPGFGNGWKWCGEASSFRLCNCLPKGGRARRGAKMWALCWRALGVHKRKRWRVTNHSRNGWPNKWVNALFSFKINHQTNGWTRCSLQRSISM